MTDYIKQIDEILDWSSNAYDTAKANGMDTDWWNYEFMLDMYKDEAKAKLQHLLQQVEVAARVDELKMVLTMKGKMLLHGVILASDDGNIDTNIIEARLQSLQKQQEQA